MGEKLLRKPSDMGLTWDFYQKHNVSAHPQFPMDSFKDAMSYSINCIRDYDRFFDNNPHNGMGSKKLLIISRK